jgi:transposase-like protein
MKVDLQCPLCKRVHRVQTTNVATDVVTYRCRGKDCRTKWQVIIRPVKVNKAMAIRLTDWLEIQERKG